MDICQKQATLNDLTSTSFCKYNALINSQACVDESSADALMLLLKKKKRLKEEAFIEET